MKVAVTGAAGQLGLALVEALKEAGHDPVALTREDLDLLDDHAEEIVSRQAVDWVIHCAAYTAVDRAETEAAIAQKVNEDGSAAVARGSERAGARLLYISTDYVFSGAASSPYPVDAPTEPINVYGQTKLAGEGAVFANHSSPLVARTSWLMGGRRPNFAATMLTLARSRDALSVVDDQRGRPTWVFDLAPALVQLLEASATGTVHVANEGEASWHGVADALFEEARRHGDELGTIELSPTTTAAFGAPAPRPAYSVLDLSRVQRDYGVTLPHWRDGLARAVEAAS